LFIIYWEISCDFNQYKTVFGRKSNGILRNAAALRYGNAGQGQGARTPAPAPASVAAI
jgi:hypothetical protein